MQIRDIVVATDFSALAEAAAVRAAHLARLTLRAAPCSVLCVKAKERRSAA